MPGMKEARHRLVDRHIATHGITDHLVLTAMRRVKRELFVPERERRACLREQTVADRLRTDDLAAVHRCVHGAGALP